MTTAPSTITASPKPAGVMPYVWAGLIFFLLGCLFILALLYLRPDLDPLILIPVVAGLAGTMFSGVAAYLKSQETHLIVNSQLTAWKKEFFEMAHAEGVIAGVDREQERIAEQLRLRNLTQDTHTSRGADPDPVPVVIENPTPVPVTVRPDKAKR